MTAPLKPAGRSLAEFQPLKPAEQKLLDACRQGEFANISDKRPEAVNDDNVVRAAFLRFLALGGDEQAPVHELGVQLLGAWIEGKLEMEAARVHSGLAIVDCHFDITPVFYDAKIAGTLNLSGCQVPGLAGEKLACEGSLLLRQGLTATVAPDIQGAGNWYLCEKLPEEYSGFSPLAYSLDVILPLVDLQQETSWAPLITTPKAAWYQELFSIFDWKHFTRLLLWFEILFGWLSSLLLVAVVSGLTKRREE